MSKFKVAFVCVHNSCRSQISEALSRYYCSSVFDSYSAGTEKSQSINVDAVRMMKMLYGIDMDKTQYPKLIDEIPEVDVVITMGCNVNCPVLPCQHREDWGIEDPTGKGDDEFIRVIKAIEERIFELKNKYININ